MVISLPNAEGNLERFEMFEASNFAPELQERFPEIRSYVGKGLDDVTAQVRLMCRCERNTNHDFQDRQEK